MRANITFEILKGTEWKQNMGGGGLQQNKNVCTGIPPFHPPQDLKINGIALTVRKPRALYDYDYFYIDLECHYSVKKKYPPPEKGPNVHCSCTTV